MIRTYFSIVVKRIEDPTKDEAELKFRINVSNNPTIVEAIEIVRKINSHVTYLRQQYIMNNNIHTYANGAEFNLSGTLHPETIVLNVLQNIVVKFQEQSQTQLEDNIRHISKVLDIVNWHDIMTNDQHRQLQVIFNRLLPQIRDIVASRNDSALTLRVDRNVIEKAKTAVIDIINRFTDNPIERRMFDQYLLSDIKKIYEKLYGHPTTGGNRNDDHYYKYIKYKLKYLNELKKNKT